MLQEPRISWHVPLQPEAAGLASGLPAAVACPRVSVLAFEIMPNYNQPKNPTKMAADVRKAGTVAAGKVDTGTSNPHRSTSIKK